MNGHRARAFTIVELLVVVSIIALLIGILLPAIGKARDQARLTTSQTNLRQLGQALASYAGEWNDRQVTICDDNLSRYGSTAATALVNYESETGQIHPAVIAGTGDAGGLWGWWFGPGSSYAPLLNAINFDGPAYGYGWFRMVNTRPLTGYLNGRTHDPIFWAPKDRIAWSNVEACFDSPFEYDPCYQSSTPGGDGDGNSVPPSYVYSPAALFRPDVFRPATAGGSQDPWSLDAGLRCPPMGAARYPDLKTHMLEHHWLQQSRGDCNPAFAAGTFDGCEPYYFNHSWESAPVTVFYDGHVQGLGVREAEAADTRVQVQAGHGLWSRDTPMGGDGYFIPEGYDFAATSFHILTTEGIRGRDRLAR
ncbi:MAG: type II secretion system protein [Planctomycetota bacterium]|jgi:type II secretory pathway pseudopilin PulG